MLTPTRLTTEVQVCRNVGRPNPRLPNLVTIRIAPSSCARKDEGNADYGGMVQPSQQHVASCVKGVEWKLGTRGLRIVAAVWAGIPISSA